MSRRIIALMASAALMSVLPGVARADDGEGGRGSPGAPGIGDPYYPLDGNGGYDVLHYDLRLRYDPDNDVLSGVARILARATQDLSSFDLDLDGMTVRSVRVDGETADWSREGQELIIAPEDTLRDGHRFTVAVRYDGVPATIEDAFGISGFMHTDDGAIVAGQPHGAATWFPANDHPRDAASVEVRITVPTGLEAISNGELEDRETHHGWTTWEWEADEPMATYLVTLAIGEFSIRSYAEDGIEFWDAVDPDLGRPVPGVPGPAPGVVAREAFARQPEMLRFLSGYFGDYPYETGGGIVDDLPEFFFALETQTRPIYASAFFFDRGFAQQVVVHELAHQWTGDLLRLDSWRDIWLNEGFATYAEWLWLHEQGLSTPQAEFDRIVQDYPAEFWSTTIGDPGPAVEDLFQGAVYDRGAMTLQALRRAVGDDVFFDVLAEWVASHAGGTVTTEEFIALAEKISGQDLGELFDVWLYTPEKPAGLR